MPAKLFTAELELWIRERYVTDGWSVLGIVRALLTDHGIETSHPVVSKALRRRGVVLRTPRERNLIYHRGTLEPPDPGKAAVLDQIRRVRKSLDAQRRRSDERINRVLNQLEQIERRIDKEVKS